MLLVLAAAEVQWVRRSDRLTVVYLLDQSLSVPQAERNATSTASTKPFAAQRKGDDRVGVIVFGREAMIELPPLDENVQVPHTIESQLDPGYTNLAGAIKLAQASFPEDSARRIVIVSDGNENLGSAKDQAELAAGCRNRHRRVPDQRRRGSRSGGGKARLAVRNPTRPAVRDADRFEPSSCPTSCRRPGRAIVGGRLIVSARTDDRRDRLER